MWRPSRSGSLASTTGGRTAGSVTRTGLLPIASTIASTMAGSSASRPTPDCPEASSPASGSTIVYPKSSRNRATFARVAGCVHISPSIAGATTTGALVARTVAVTASPDSPLAMAASQCAVAGATTIPSTVSATTMWPIRPSGSSASTSVSTAWRDRDANVRGPTNAVAAGVSIATTSAPSARSRRRSSTALYAAMEPVTPRPMSRPSSRPVTAGRAPAAPRRRPRRAGSRGPSRSGRGRSRRSLRGRAPTGRRTARQ